MSNICILDYTLQSEKTTYRVFHRKVAGKITIADTDHKTLVEFPDLWDGQQMPRDIAAIIVLAYTSGKLDAHRDVYHIVRGEMR